ncbi:hypothetical protein GOP47_0016222 [Adiantum capillus-veneris]|uniref:Uncharacterized protein n=1 Tax=Adiantum capillus-veneris TaxID=13818 RepID=A0A9D4UHP1_ADICA|nr:hypothetical protein GOP47_0016222 [Adiantum capillus-veneris]
MSPRNMEKKVVYSEASSLIVDDLVPAWNSKIKPNFDSVQASSQKECLRVFKDNQEIIEVCLKACLPEHKPRDPVQLPIRVLLPFLKKWRVLDMHWYYPVVAILVINALGRCKREANEMVELPLDLTFGAQELLERWLCEKGKPVTNIPKCSKAFTYCQ